MSATCRSCEAPIIWAKTVSGRRMPVDAEPIAELPEQGVFVLLRTADDPLAIALTGITQLAAESAKANGVPLFRSHFASCEQADEWRRSA